MTKAREIMTEGIAYVKESEAISEVAKRLAQDDIGSLPVCRDDGHLSGMVTDRDIVVKVVAKGQDPARTRAGDLSDQEEVVTIGADDDVKEIVRTMKAHKVRRLPVVDGDRLVGVVAQADLAGRVPAEDFSDLLSAISG